MFKLAKKRMNQCRIRLNCRHITADYHAYNIILSSFTLYTQVIIVYFSLNHKYLAL